MDRVSGSVRGRHRHLGVQSSVTGSGREGGGKRKGMAGWSDRVRVMGQGAEVLQPARWRSGARRGGEGRGEARRGGEGRGGARRNGAGRGGGGGDGAGRQCKDLGTGNEEGEVGEESRGGRREEEEEEQGGKGNRTGRGRALCQGPRRQGAAEGLGARDLARGKMHEVKNASN